MENIFQNNLKKWLKKELPLIIEKDPAIREILIEILKPYFAEKKVTEDRFEKILLEIKNLQEEIKALREESERKWEENQRKWEENQRKWEENQRKWEENQKRWEENQKIIRQILERQEKDRRFLLDKLHTTLGALGARWGIKSEQSFRKAICKIFKEFLPEFKVERFEVMDEGGEVFGFPASIELDLIIKNGKLVIAEIKSSMSFNDMVAFLKKARFYEKHTGRKADALWVISPMVDKSAKKFAKKYKIAVFSSPEFIEEKDLP